MYVETKWWHDHRRIPEETFINGHDQDDKVNGENHTDTAPHNNNAEDNVADDLVRNLNVSQAMAHEGARNRDELLFRWWYFQNIYTTFNDNPLKRFKYFDHTWFEAVLAAFWPYMIWGRLSSFDLDLWLCTW